MLLYDTMQYSTIQCSTVRYNTVRYSTVQNSTASARNMLRSLLSSSLMYYYSVFSCLLELLYHDFMTSTIGLLNRESEHSHSQSLSHSLSYYCTVLCCAELHCTVLYCIVLHCTVCRRYRHFKSPPSFKSCPLSAPLFVH
jgi:hypothetical protein